MAHNEDHLIGANREDPEYEDALASFWRRLEKERDDKKKEKKADKVGGKKHKKSRHHRSAKGGTYMNSEQQVESYDLNTMRNWRSLQGPKTRKRSQQMDGHEWVNDTDGLKHVSEFEEEQNNRATPGELIKDGYVSSNTRDLMDGGKKHKKTRHHKKSHKRTHHKKSHHKKSHKRTHHKKTHHKRRV